MCALHLLTLTDLIVNQCRHLIQFLTLITFIKLADRRLLFSNKGVFVLQLDQNVVTQSLLWELNRVVLHVVNDLVFEVLTWALINQRCYTTLCGHACITLSFSHLFRFESLRSSSNFRDVAQIWLLFKWYGYSTSACLLLLTLGFNRAIMLCQT